MLTFVVWTVTFVYILFHIHIWSTIYIIFPNLSCLGVSREVGKGYYQQMTLLKVDELSLGQILAVITAPDRSRVSSCPRISYAQLLWISALMQAELSMSMSGKVWHGNHCQQNLALDLFKWRTSRWTRGNGGRGWGRENKERRRLPVWRFSCRTKSLKSHLLNKWTC